VRQLVATLRRRPGPLAGTFVALFAGAVVVTLTASLAWAGHAIKPPVQRLAGADAVLTGNPSVKAAEGKHADAAALPDYRRLPVSLAASVAAVKGVTGAIPDVSIPLALQSPGRPAVIGSSADPVTGHRMGERRAHAVRAASWARATNIQPDRCRGGRCREWGLVRRQPCVARWQ
jgi:putative ABC transport system permease protein